MRDRHSDHAAIEDLCQLGRWGKWMTLATAAGLATAVGGAALWLVWSHRITLTPALSYVVAVSGSILIVTPWAALFLARR